MDFATLKALSIPEGVVKKIETNGAVLWEEPSSYTNQVPISKDANGNILDGKGYVTDTRLSSSGATKGQSGVMTTGYIPAKPNAIIRIAEIEWLGVNASANYVCCYDSDHNFVCAVNSNGYYGGGTLSGDSNVAIVTLPSTNTIAYVRVSVYDGTHSYNQLIVTVNEEITD